MIAPRPFLEITGQNDSIFSSFVPPFASTKQVARRARAAYADLGALAKHVHFLYRKGAQTDAENGHYWHAGLAFPPPHDGDALVGVLEPIAYGPTQALPFFWQTNGDTTQTYASVFDAVHALLP